MSFPRYPKYKDSGAEWLGDVPEHWDVKRLSHHFTERRERVSDLDYPPLSVTKHGVVPQLDTAAKTDDNDNRKRVCVGDFVINSRSDRKGSGGVSDRDGSVSQISTVLRPHEPGGTPFVHYLLRSQPFQEEFYRCGKGIVADLWSTNFSDMRNIVLAMPCLVEQMQITRFLNAETATINALVAEQRRLVELLKEKRQADISHAVTRGLNPNAPMKASGIDWLGDVPATWEVVPVKRLSRFLTSGPRGWSERIAEEGALFVQSGDLDDNLRVEFAACKRVQIEDDAEANRTRLQEGDIVVCITGAKTGNVAVCTDMSEAAYVNQHLCLVRPTSGILPVFLGAALKSHVGATHFELSQYGLKQGLSLQDVGEAPIARPPLTEQAAIRDHLAKSAAAPAALITDAERAIALLQERRTALISAAVTGKIDVRAFAAAAAPAA